MEKPMTECAVCEKKIEVLEKFKGEMMCEECYHDPANHVFGSSEEEL